MDSGAVVAIGVALLVLVVVLPLAITHGTNNVRQLEDAWRKLAERHHLRYERSSRFKLPSISGEVGGRALLIKREPGQDASPIRVQLTLHGPLPDGLHIGPHQARVEVLGHVLISGGINTQDAAFDEEVDVKGDDPDSIRQYLTDGRKRAAAQVVELGGELENGILIVPVNRDVELESLERVVRELREVAGVLDSARDPLRSSG